MSWFIVCCAIVRWQNTQIQHLNDEKKAILNYIGQHYHENLTLPQIAHEFGLSEAYFSRRFHQSFGISFKQYLEKYRMYRAIDDLVGTDKTLQEISRAHGFANSKSFINRFRSIYHLTPKQFRQQEKKARNDRFSDNNEQQKKH